LGHYERFLNLNLHKDSSIMTGKIYAEVIAKERRGNYLGKTVQVIPHITDEIKFRIRCAAKRRKADIHIVEIGGTVGDYEGSHYLEAARQLRQDEGPHNVLFVHVTFLPYLSASEEVKTKPTQNSVRDLREIGIQPDVIVGRTDHHLNKDVIHKISLFCNVEKRAVVPLVTAKTPYEVPVTLRKYKLDRYILEKLHLRPKANNHKKWKNFVHKILKSKKSLSIALVGKYMKMKDTYLSINEALKTAGWYENHNVNIIWVDSEKLSSDKKLVDVLKKVSGVLVPGGFGPRGIEGKIKAAKFCRENKVPFLGICLGMQIAVIEFARSVLRSKDVNSEEFNKRVKHPVIHLMEGQKKIKNLGASQRLGAWPCVLDPASLSFKAYGEKKIWERHRHRYEFNNAYRHILEKNGLLLAGLSPDKKLVEIIEIKNHPFFVGVQFHPEFKSRPLHPHPLFREFIRAAIKYNKNQIPKTKNEKHKLKNEKY